MTIFGELRRILRLPEPYTRADFEAREPWRPAYRVVAGALLEHLEFRSVIDIGCGNGFLLSEFERAGKQITGVELSHHVRDVLPKPIRASVQIADFADTCGSFDLVCCVEVAEHIPPKRSEELVESLTRVASDWIYFTAAPPGQKGHGHINCRPIANWLEMFKHHGWQQDSESTLRFRQKLLAIEGATWLINNSVLLRRRAADGELLHCVSEPVQGEHRAADARPASSPGRI